MRASKPPFCQDCENDDEGAPVESSMALAVRTFCGQSGRPGQNVAMCPETIEIVDASATGKVPDAAELFFEYMAATLQEVGWSVPTGPSELPEEWRSEVEHLASAYPPPGALLVVYRRNSPIGAVGMQMRDSHVAEVKHLYVRPDERGGVGRQLMDALRSRAKENGLQRLVLDVLISRDNAINFYRRLGYVDTEPYRVEPVPVRFLGLDLTEPGLPPRRREGLSSCEATCEERAERWSHSRDQDRAHGAASRDRGEPMSEPVTASPSQPVRLTPRGRSFGGIG